MTQPKFKIKKGDMVEVMTGKDKGRRGQVQRVLLADAQVVVEGVHQVTRFLKPSQTNPEGRVNKTLPVNISNVALVDPSTNQVGKVGYRVNKEGNKERFFKKSGTAL